MKIRILGCLVGSLLLAVPAMAAGGDDIPQWRQQAAASQAPTYEKGSPSVVLLDEQVVQIGADGRIRSTSTYAVFVLVHMARFCAQANGFCQTDSSSLT